MQIQFPEKGAAGPRPAKIRYISKIDKIPQIPPEDREALRAVERRFAFRITDYYLSLIDWTDPKDPIRQLIIPRREELSGWGELDASNEKAVTVAHGCQHKYPDTALLLCNEVCGAYCRYCFRKRLFMNGNDEATLDVSEGLRYIAEHPEITNVLLTGGDPLLMAPKKLLEIVARVRRIPHVNIIRIGSKMPAFNPWVILDHPELLEGLSRWSTPEKRVYLMMHFDHPRELTEPALEAIDRVVKAGIIPVNQCPMIKGVNDNVDTLVELFRKLSFAGCPPYYIFQGRPTKGNEPYELPIVRGFKLFDQARRRVSGLAARARMAMSHESGKIEILGVDNDHIYLRYHRAKRPENRGRFMIFKRNDQAYWLDQLEPADTATRTVARKPERMERSVNYWS
ncbi:MAG: radical SAM protein [Deltaproteobacteria bacterium]|nr:radical SAM protein [Deltaproteobacteria bacterium]